MTSTVTYLEMTSRAQFRPATGGSELELRVVEEPETSARLYREVGGPWQWTDRLSWTGRDWQGRMEQTGVETWLFLSGGREMGYVEWHHQEAGSIEIVYFGLHPEMIGRGLGAGALTRTLRELWDQPTTRRIWLHTCSEDHPHALANYQKRGFQIYKTESVKASD